MMELFEIRYHPDNKYLRATELEWSLFVMIKELSARVEVLEAEIKKAKADTLVCRLDGPANE